MAAKYKIKIKDMPKPERPREKLINKGPEALKNKELLAILLGSGYEGKNVIAIAENLLNKYPVENLADVPFAKIKNLKGIGHAKACKLLAAFELSRRVFSINTSPSPIIQNPDDVLAVIADLHKNKKEHLVALYLNARNQLLHKETISVGSLNVNMINPREVFSPALEHSAAYVILAHNHPSGEATPSKEDVQVTRRIVKAGKIMGIDVLDHIIVGNNSHVSLEEEKLI